MSPRSSIVRHAAFGAPFLALAGLALAGLAFPGLAAPASAAEEILTIDPAQSKLAFVLGATGHQVHGELALESGQVRFDRDSGSAGGEIVIDAAKTKTGSDGRDEKMHAEVLKSATFPKIRFTPQKLEGRLQPSGKSGVGLRGRIELAGVSRELLLPAEVEIAGSRLTAKSEFKIPFVAWGLHDPSVLFLRVDKEIAVTLAIAGELSLAAAAP